MSDSPLYGSQSFLPVLDLGSVGMSMGVMRSLHVTYCLVLATSALVGFRHALMYIGNDDMGIQYKFGLRRERLVATKLRHAGRTLKTWRSLVRSDFHPAITSLLFLE